MTILAISLAVIVVCMLAGLITGLEEKWRHIRPGRSTNQCGRSINQCARCGSDNGIHVKSVWYGGASDHVQVPGPTIYLCGECLRNHPNPRVLWKRVAFEATKGGRLACVTGYEADGWLEFDDEAKSPSQWERDYSRALLDLEKGL